MHQWYDWFLHCQRSNNLPNFIYYVAKDNRVHPVLCPCKTDGGSKELTGALFLVPYSVHIYPYMHTHIVYKHMVYTHIHICIAISYVNTHNVYTHIHICIHTLYVNIYGVHTHLYTHGLHVYIYGAYTVSTYVHTHIHI